MKKHLFGLAAAAGLLLFSGSMAMLPNAAVFGEEAQLVYETQGWRITLDQASRTSSLSTVSVALGYASVETTNLATQASDGMEFCLLRLIFEKNGSSEAIQWDNLRLTDGQGNEYSRMDDDFITDYGMARLPGTDLNFGTYEGWIAFEIPQDAEDLSLVYSFESEDLVIPVNAIREDSDAQSASEASSESSSETAEASSENASDSSSEADTQGASEASSESSSETVEASSENASDSSSEVDTQGASEASSETAEASSESSSDSAQTVTWQRLDSYDYFTDQRAIDSDLYSEAQNGYTFEDPFVVVNPYGNSPLSAMVIFTTSQETSVELTVHGKDSANDISTVFSSATTHILPVYGLYAGDTTSVELTLDTGETTELEITTEALDTILTEAEVTVSEEDAIDDGTLTFVCVSTADGGSYSAAAYDNAGDLRWILEGSEGQAFPLKRLENGHMMMPSSRLLESTYYVTGLIEFDLCGKIYTEYLVPGGQHHDFLELSNGNLLVASDTTDFSTVEDRIVEIDRETGEVVYELNIGDLINPSDGGSMNRTDEDWCHNNSMDYDEETDTLILSCRHLDAVLGIDKSEKELLWVLGDPSGFTDVPADKFFTPINTENGFEWSYAQHNATFTPDGDILLFDNGTSRTKTGREEEAVTGDAVYSRAVVYRLDTEAMTIEQVWTYGKERGAQWYSSFISGAQYLGENNYWITSGGICYDAEADTYDVALSGLSSYEHQTYIDQVKDGELVYELSLPILSYRSTRMTMYAPEDAYSVYDRGIWLGDLETVAQTEMENVDLSSAQTVDFTITTFEQNPDRIVLEGSWTETGEDAALIFVDENDDQYAFAIDQPAYDTGAGTEDFSLWLTASSLPYSHRYKIYIYNNGIVYTTGTFFDNYVDTSNELSARGPQYVLYDVEGDTNTLVSSDTPEITTNVETETSLPVQTQEIQDQIYQELEQNTYTFQEPLVIQNPYQIAPLTALAAFVSDEAAQVRVTVQGKTESRNITDTISPDSTGQLETEGNLFLVPILGLYADYENQVVLELLDENGNVLDTNTLTIQTDVLPEYLRTAVTTGSYSTKSAMDLMMISGLETPYLYAFDEVGDIRWYCTLEGVYYGGFPLANGHILAESTDVLFPNASMPNSPEMLEIDYLGRVYNIYYFPDGVHHELIEKTPDGNFLAATSSNDGYEQNMIQEIDRETGEVVKSLNLNDVFAGLEYIDSDDWCHLNTISYDESTDSILISARNLHSVIRINWSTDEIMWILGDPLLWEGTAFEDKVLTPTADFQWHYQQHTAYPLSEDLDGNPDTVEIMLFDNHNARYQMLDDYYDTGNSYVKIYSVDPGAMTVTLLKSYPTVYSSITSSAFLEGDRVFSVNAYVSGESYEGRVYEIDYNSGGELNTWLISHRFYRGYNISLSMSALSDGYVLSDNYRKGELRTPVEAAAKDAVRLSGTVSLTEDVISFTLQENILYLYGSDHTYNQIIFNGDEHTYVYDLSDIKLISDNVGMYSYRLPIPLDELAPDAYTVQVMYGNRLSNTDVLISIADSGQAESASQEASSPETEGTS